MMMFLWLSLSALTFGLGGYLSKRWVAHPSPGLLLALILSFMASTLFWLPALRIGKNLIVVGPASVVMCSVVTVLVGVACFNERLGWHTCLGGATGRLRSLSSAVSLRMFGLGILRLLLANRRTDQNMDGIVVILLRARRLAKTSSSCLIGQEQSCRLGS